MSRGACTVKYAIFAQQRNRLSFVYFLVIQMIKPVIFISANCHSVALLEKAQSESALFHIIMLNSLIVNLES